MADDSGSDRHVVTEIPKPTTTFITSKPGKTASARSLARTDYSTSKWPHFNAPSFRQARIAEPDFQESFRRTSRFPGKAHARDVAEAEKVSRLLWPWTSAASSWKLTKGIDGQFATNNQVSTTFYALFGFRGWRGRVTILFRYTVQK